MAIYDGFVSSDDGDVRVMLGVDEDRVTMSSNGSEIGQWPAEDVDVDHLGDGVYRTQAEEESLRFVPNNPNLFGLTFKGHEVEAEEVNKGRYDSGPEKIGGEETAPPKTATMAMF